MMRSRWIGGLVVALVAGLFAGGPEPAPPPVRIGGDDAWRTDPLWDDGKAEYAAYRVRWRRYGELHSGRVLTVLVKEPWDAAEEVKSEGAGDLDVLKLNVLRTVPTGIYTYHQMASIFVGRDDGTLRKVTGASAEACGHAFATMTGGKLRTFSYWDDEAEVPAPWPKDALPEDGLPMVLRGFVEGEVPESLSVFPTLMSSRHPLLEPSDFALSRGSRAALEVPAGRFDAVELKLEAGRRWMRFAFAAERPHTLLRYERHDGTTYELMKVERTRYWERNASGQEAWWPEELR